MKEIIFLFESIISIFWKVFFLRWEFVVNSFSDVADEWLDEFKKWPSYHLRVCTVLYASQCRLWEIPQMPMEQELWSSIEKVVPKHHYNFHLNESFPFCALDVCSRLSLMEVTACQHINKYSWKFFVFGGEEQCILDVKKNIHMKKCWYRYDIDVDFFQPVISTYSKNPDEFLLVPLYAPTTSSGYISLSVLHLLF